MQPDKMASNKRFVPAAVFSAGGQRQKIEDRILRSHSHRPGMELIFGPLVTLVTVGCSL
jgi:hypothetical protein